MVGHPRGDWCASTMYDMAVCKLGRVVGCARGARSQIPCSGSDAMEVRRGQGHMQASIGETLQHEHHIRRSTAGIDRADHGKSTLSCVPPNDLGNHSDADLGNTVGR